MNTAADTEKITENNHYERVIDSNYTANPFDARYFSSLPRNLGRQERIETFLTHEKMRESRVFATGC